MRRIVTAVKAAFSDLAPSADDVVHFHQGPSGAPATCYDPRCGSPRMLVD